jgi:hypothetical protein
MKQKKQLKNDLINTTKIHVIITEQMNNVLILFIILTTECFLAKYNIGIKSDNYTWNSDRLLLTSKYPSSVSLKM